MDFGPGSREQSFFRRHSPHSQIESAWDGGLQGRRESLTEVDSGLVCEDKSPFL